MEKNKTAITGYLENNNNMWLKLKEQIVILLKLFQKLLQKEIIAKSL